MIKNYKKKAVKKIFLIFVIIFSFFLIGDTFLSKQINSNSTLIETKITIENTIKDSVILDIFLQQQISKSLIFNELELIMERVKPAIHVGTLVTNDFTDNTIKISLIIDEIKKIQEKVDLDITHYINTTKGTPNSPFLGSKQTVNSNLIKLTSVKYAIDNNFEFILVKYDESIIIKKKTPKLYSYIYYFILSMIISLFISYLSASRMLKEYSNILKKFI
jgi:hypothetical protein